MKSFLKLITLATIAILYHTIQTSRNKRTVNLAHDMGVKDGINQQRSFELLRSKQMELEMIKTKYGRYAKVVE